MRDRKRERRVARCRHAVNQVERGGELAADKLDVPLLRPRLAAVCTSAMAEES